VSEDIATPRGTRLLRIAGHIREQNWTAIGIDFVIVVIGVFFGIQVSNWNQERQARGEERELLGRLKLEIQQNAAAAQEKRRFFDKVYASADRTYEFLDDDAPCSADCWQRVVDAFYASQWRDLRPTRDAFDEMERLGLPRDTGLKVALSNYYGLYESMVSITSDLPEYRAAVRSLLPPQVQLHLWRQCHRIEGVTELLAADCPAALGEVESREVLEQLRTHQTLRPALASWMSTVALTQPALDQQALGAEKVLVSINAELGEGP
jgi:hypothetical protein